MKSNNLQITIEKEEDDEDCMQSILFKDDNNEVNLDFELSDIIDFGDSQFTIISLKKCIKRGQIIFSDLDGGIDLSICDVKAVFSIQNCKLGISALVTFDNTDDAFRIKLLEVVDELKCELKLK